MAAHAGASWNSVRRLLPRRRARRRGPLAFLRRWTGRLVALLLALVLCLRFVPPPLNLYQAQEWLRLGRIDKDWVALASLPAHVADSAIAAEDARFCDHWGIDTAAVRAALAEGGTRGASTISQQTVKNVFLWQGRSWVRKGLEAALTPLVELAWGKRRIIEVYLNVAEFAPGVFGVEAAARHHFGIAAADLSPGQSARLMAVLPDPRDRSAGNPSRQVARRAAAIAAGAATVRADGRAACIG
jgi:monofunctional biosynthetic peptidoglycan transglycosylase